MPISPGRGIWWPPGSPARTPGPAATRRCTGGGAVWRSDPAGRPRCARLIGRRALPSTADLVDVLQHFGRVFIDAERARLLQLLDPVAAAHQADAERAAAHRGEHVPDAVADHHGVLGRRAKPLGGG